MEKQRAQRTDMPREFFKGRTFFNKVPKKKIVYVDAKKIAKEIKEKQQIGS